MNNIEMLYKNGALGDNFKDNTTLSFKGYNHNKDYELLKFKSRLEQGNYGYNVERIKKDLMDKETFKFECLDKHTLNYYKQGIVNFNYFTPRSFTELFKKIILYFTVYKIDDNINNGVSNEVNNNVYRSDYEKYQVERRLYHEYRGEIYDEFYKKINWKKLLTEKLFGITDIKKYVNCNSYNSGNECYLFFELEDYRYCISMFYS